MQFPASPALIGSVEGPTKQARGDAPDDPAPSCPAEGSDSGAGGPPGGPKPASQEAAGPPPHCAAPGVATLRGAQGAGPGAARGKVPRGGAPLFAASAGYQSVNNQVRLSTTSRHGRRRRHFFCVVPLLVGFCAKHDVIQAKHDVVSHVVAATQGQGYY